MKNIKYIRILVVITILAFVSLAFIIPNVQATSLTNRQQAVSTLNNVVGLDLSKYTLTSVDEPTDSFQGLLPRENVRVIMNSTDSNLETLNTYVNTSLQMVYTLSNQGTPRMTLSSNNPVDMARSFLTNYQSQYKNSLYGQLFSMLPKNGMAINSTVISSDLKLNITTLDKTDTTFRWTYSINGVEAPDKCIILRYTNGFLNYFIDNWNYYNVGNTKFSLSQQDAVNIALDASRNYSPDSTINGTIGGMKFNVANAMVVQTIYSPSIYVDPEKAHSQDPLELYPMYNVWVSLDKFYPGDVYGFNVYIWADTKQVCYINQRVSSIDPPSDMIAISTNATTTTVNKSSMLENSLVNTLLICTIPVFAATSIYLLKKKMVLHTSKFDIKKVGGAFVLIMTIFLLVSALSTPFVEAKMYYGGASIWGAESTGAINPNTGESWRKSNDEVTAQRNVASYVAGLFASNGYSNAYSINNQGSNGAGSSASAILTKVSSLEAGYTRYAVIDFDHGVGNPINGEFHYMFEDNVGTAVGPYYDQFTWNIMNAVYDDSVFDRTTGEGFFVFINTCLSADYTNEWGAISPTDSYPSQTQGMLPDNNARGMPYAWTHRIVGSGGMSTDGFHSPDGGSNVYIGFDYGSPSLNETIGPGGHKYQYWVNQFFYYALANDYTVHQALDFASQSTFNGLNFDQSPLWTSFVAIWPTYKNGAWDYSNSQSNCHMRIYGNANLKLFQPQVTLSDGSGAGGAFYVDGNYVGTGNIRTTSQFHTFDVTVPSGYQFDHFVYHDSYGDSYIYYHPVTIAINRAATLTAYYSSNAQRYVSVSATADVSATASQYYTQGTSPTISWQSADDYGNYYCYLTEVIVDGVSHNPTDYGSANAGSITFNNIQSDHSVVVHSAPYYYPVTFNQYAHDDSLGDMLVNSWTEYHVAWEEVGGPHYSHGSDLHGGGGEDYYVSSTINDPWGYGTDNFNYAMAHNWGGGSESYYYSIPLNVWTYTWGNTVDIYYNDSPGTYSTTVNVWVTYDGYNFYYQSSYNINEPAGSNYLDFGYNFISAYNYYDSSWHYSNPDWYNLGTGTTIDVGYWGY